MLAADTTQPAQVFVQAPLLGLEGLELTALSTEFGVSGCLVFDAAVATLCLIQQDLLFAQSPVSRRQPLGSRMSGWGLAALGGSGASLAAWLSNQPTGTPLGGFTLTARVGSLVRLSTQAVAPLSLVWESLDPLFLVFELGLLVLLLC